MTTQEKNTKIAEHCGYNGFVWIEPDGPANHWRKNGIIYSELELPNYFLDLNAMHEAEKTLTLEQRDAYATLIFDMNRQLENTTEGGLTQGNEAFGVRTCMAPASQRAEAFGKTLNLW